MTTIQNGDCLFLTIRPIFIKLYRNVKTLMLDTFLTTNFIGQHAVLGHVTDLLRYACTKQIRVSRNERPRCNDVYTTPLTNGYMQVATQQISVQSEKGLRKRLYTADLETILAWSSNDETKLGDCQWKGMQLRQYTVYEQ